VDNDRWSEGETVSLVHSAGAPVVLRLARGPTRLGDLGVLDLTTLIGAPVGGAVPWLGSTYRAVRPSLGDLLSGVRRGAQIVTPKDAVRLLELASVGPGARVAEAGSGSGGLTTVLAWSVGERGRVVSYDRRREFLEVARANIERAGLADRVEFRERDVARDGMGEGNFSSVVLDLAEPWEVVAHAREALRVGGYLTTYTPTYNQLERTVRAIRDHGFAEVRALELLERGLHVGEGGTRPEFDMLGHTGFLAAGRRVD
jgi:tRNA (adenine57-N1/adenine58-N1)-methyltransferase